MFVNENELTVRVWLYDTLYRVSLFDAVRPLNVLVSTSYWESDDSVVYRLGQIVWYVRFAAALVTWLVTAKSGQGVYLAHPLVHK